LKILTIAISFLGNMRQVMKKLPTFRTQEEEISFWEKHSISEYWEDIEESTDTFKRPKLIPVTLKFDPR